MKFDKNGVLGRNGFDEFCIFLPDCICADVKEKLEEFTKKIFLKIFQEHLSFTKQIRMMMKFFLQTANLSDLQAVRTWMNCLNIQKEVSVISLVWINGKLL